MHASQELWLGKNKIEAVKGIETLAPKLRRLDIQSNRYVCIYVGRWIVEGMEAT
jgi:hypothetical protein